MRFSICCTTFCIVSRSLFVVMINLCIPSIAEAETERLSIFRRRRPKIIYIWFRRPTLFSVYTVTVYNIDSICFVQLIFFSTV